MVAPIAVASAALALLSGELVARLAIRTGRYFVFMPGQRERHHLHLPTHSNLEPVVRRMINALGERGRPLPKRGPVYRVLVVGGSAAECFTQDQDTQWPAVLEAALRKPEALARLGAADAHVGNIGRSGVDSGSLDLMLARVLPNYPRLNLIVVMVGASDVLRWLEAGAPANRPAAPLPEAALFSWYPGLLLGWSPKRWALAAWVRRWRSRIWTDELDSVSWMGRARRDRANALVTHDSAPGGQVVLDAFRSSMHSLLRQAAAHAGRVLVVSQPWFDKENYTPDEEALLWNGSVGQAYRGTVTAFYSSEVICRLMTQIDAAAAEVSDEERAEFLRLQGKVSQSADHFIDHFHSTPSGSLRIGELVARAVLSTVG